MNKRVLGIISALALVATLAVGFRVHYFQIPHASASPSVVATQDTNAAASSTCPNKIISWNLDNFGKSKIDDALLVMVDVMRSADIVMVVEVNAGKEFGAKRLGDLVDLLTRTGSEWDYIVSDPTQPKTPGQERYAFLIKRGVKFNRDTAHLVKELEDPIDREPYSVKVILHGGKEVTLFAIHTVPTAKHPEREVEALLGNDEVKAEGPAIFAGDFNLGPSSTDPVFTQMGYIGTINEKTSIKNKVDESKSGTSAYLRHQYDNIYVKGLKVLSSGAINFVEGRFSITDEESLKAVKKVSDHLPVYVCVE